MARRRSVVRDITEMVPKCVAVRRRPVAKKCHLIVHFDVKGAPILGRGRNVTKGSTAVWWIADFH